MGRPKLKTSEIRKRAQVALEEAQSPYLIGKLRDPKIKRWGYRISQGLRKKQLGRYVVRAINPTFGKDGIPYLQWRAKLYGIDRACRSEQVVIGWRQKMWLVEQIKQYRSFNLTNAQQGEMDVLLKTFPFLYNLKSLHSWRKVVKTVIRFEQKNARLPVKPEREVVSLQKLVWIYGMPGGKEFILACTGNGDRMTRNLFENTVLLPNGLQPISLAR